MRKPTILATIGLGIAATLVLGLAAHAAAADAKALLEPYFAVRAALAGDSIEGLQEPSAALAAAAEAAAKEKGGPTAGLRDLAKAARALAAATEIGPARKAFGEASKAAIGYLEALRKAQAPVPSAYVYRCDMAKPFGLWLQETDDMGNPYYGASMLKCGKVIACFGDAREKPGGDGGHGDRKGGCCGGEKKQGH